MLNVGFLWKQSLGYKMYITSTTMKVKGQARDRSLTMIKGPAKLQPIQCGALKQMLSVRLILCQTETTSPFQPHIAQSTTSGHFGKDMTLTEVVPYC